MSCTPEVPSSIRDICHDGFRNVFEYPLRGRDPFPDHTRPNLWGTETLGGDWNGTLLIVLKDFAPTEDLENRSDGGALYSHRPDFPTNTNLVSFLRSSGVNIDLCGKARTSCGLLIASASFLLRIGSGESRSGPPIPASVLEASWPALEFTICKMPKLTDIALCGVEAFNTFRDNGKLAANRLDAQENRQFVDWRKYRIHCTTHTQPTAVNTRKDPKNPDMSAREIAQEDWKAICKRAFQAR
jgi:hypothetical protein